MNNKPKTKIYNPKSNQQYLYAHVKRDGEFVQVVKPFDGGRVFLYSSLPRDITADMCWHRDYEKWDALPSGAVLLGEVWLPGSTSSAVKTARIAKNTALRVDFFAIQQWPKFDRVVTDSWELETIQTMLDCYGLNFIQFTRNYPIADLEAVRKSSVDVEGFVMKNGNMLDWTKLKPRTTIDCIVSGYIDGAGKYSGLLGSIKVSTSEGYEIASVSGMTDDQRRYMSERQNELIGTVVEVEYQGVGSQGRLRHPSYVRMRDDKAAADCTLAQDADLFAYYHEKLF